ncbi:MAG: hypothetical protein AAF762_04740 [Pseudomonadota bacterium]
MLFPAAAAAQDGIRLSDRLLDIDELQTLLSGQVVEFFDGSKSRYTAAGRYGYTYTDDGPIWAGTYTVVGPSEVCVAFDNGSNRCDLMVDDGLRMVLITSDGLRFPIRNITVDTTDG